MASTSELSSFVKKFVNLWQAGRNATLHMETKTGNAFVNLSLDLGQVQQQRVHREGENSRQRRKARRAAERLASSNKDSGDMAEEAEIGHISKTKDDVVVEKESDHETTGENPEQHRCDLCEKMFKNLKGLRIHIAKQHGQNSSPIPQVDGTSEENIEYEIILEAPKVCTDDDTEEVLNTNFHCPLDDKDISKSDVIRHFVLKKMCETELDECISRVFRFSVKKLKPLSK